MKPTGPNSRPTTWSDFDDLIFLGHDLLRDHPDILTLYRKRFLHLLVDEFQDTDPEQYALVRLLGDGHRSIFIVDDDEQSIYGWRYADPENIARFQAEILGGADPIVLEENYRSSREILRLARDLILHNKTLYPRDVHARKPGAQVRGVAFDAFQDEGQFIAADIWDHITHTPDLSHGEIAVLYPQHAIGAELEKILMATHVPCQMAHRRGLFDQPALRRALSVLRYALNGEDDASLELFLRRELDAADPVLYPAIRAHADREEIRSFKTAAFSYLRTASEAEALEVERALGLAGAVANAVQKGSGASLPGLIDDILDQLNTSALPALKNHLGAIADPLDLPGLPASLEKLLPLYRNGGSLYISCRDEVLRHNLLTLVRDALSRPGLTLKEAAPGSRLDLTSGDRHRAESDARYLHLAFEGLKGERASRYRRMAHERILPNIRAMRSNDRKKLEEQRRLLYVGITRAMDRLTLTCVRHRPGRDVTPSRFWDDLPLHRDEH